MAERLTIDDVLAAREAELRAVPRLAVGDDVECIADEVAEDSVHDGRA